MGEVEESGIRILAIAEFTQRTVVQATSTGTSEPSDPGGAMTFNGIRLEELCTSRVGIRAGMVQLGVPRRRDSIRPGNGAYTVSGYRPVHEWPESRDFGSPTPMMEGRR